MSANAITLFRLFLTFVVLAVFGQHYYIDIACVIAIFIIFLLDTVDGIVARKRGETSTFGAVFDIAADRVVENVFWIYFAYIDLIPVWMPIAVVSRGFLIDGIRSIALTDGKTAFEMMTIPWTRALTSSRFSRFLYGFTKVVAFLFLATVPILEESQLDNSITEIFSTTTFVIAIIAVVMCLIRGFPVLIDGWKYVKDNTQ
ncbi:MAG: CDP-alcohol phosphatidyltransferase family protein [Candidatus Poribacteria bacterium]|nr:CDP-alcohol phosphatidyltransferase family protein [Candidatus Poribacteria bacterium]